MTNLCERRTVHVPEREASHCLAAFFAEHHVYDGAVESLAVRLGVVSFYSLQWVGDQHPTYSVTWSAKIEGLFPQFAGALAVEGLENGDAFGLILSGNYQPPFGTVGTLLDALLGRRIARDCARGILQSIAHHVEHPGGLTASARAPLPTRR